MKDENGTYILSHLKVIQFLSSFCMLNAEIGFKIISNTRIETND